MIKGTSKGMFFKPFFGVEKQCADAFYSDLIAETNWQNCSVKCGRDLDWTACFFSVEVFVLMRTSVRAMTESV